LEALFQDVIEGMLKKTLDKFVIGVNNAINAASTP